MTGKCVSICVYLQCCVGSVSGTKYGIVLCRLCLGGRGGVARGLAAKSERWVHPRADFAKRANFELPPYGRVEHERVIPARITGKKTKNLARFGANAGQAIFSMRN